MFSRLIGARARFGAGSAAGAPSVRGAANSGASALDVFGFGAARGTRSPAGAATLPASRGVGPKGVDPRLDDVEAGVVEPGVELRAAVRVEL